MTLLFIIIFISCVGSVLSSDTKKKLCGGLDHAALTRPCFQNDTYCGRWKQGRVWVPHRCNYRHVTSENARKCLGNHTIACMGDSIVRDICQAVIRLLLEKPDAPQMTKQGKFDHHAMDMYGTRIDDVPWWQHNVPAFNYNGYIYPQPFNTSFASHTWQLQLWNFFGRIYSKSPQVDDVLTNRMVNASQGIRPIDFMLWGVGLHDYGFFINPPRGENFLQNIIGRYYIKRRAIMKYPVVWVPMNKNCPRLLGAKYVKRDQHGMVDEANYYANRYFSQNKFPYWDADAVLRHTLTCVLSADGVHVQMYVDNMRAKMLFNHLCDEEWNWRTNVQDYFV